MLVSVGEKEGLVRESIRLLSFLLRNILDRTRQNTYLDEGHPLPTHPPFKSPALFPQHGAIRAEPLFLLYLRHLSSNRWVVAVLVPRLIAPVAEHDHVACWAVAALAVLAYRCRTGRAAVAGFSFLLGG